MDLDELELDLVRDEDQHERQLVDRLLRIIDSVQPRECTLTEDGGVEAADRRQGEIERMKAEFVAEAARSNACWRAAKARRISAFHLRTGHRLARTGRPRRRRPAAVRRVRSRNGSRGSPPRPDTADPSSELAQPTMRAAA
jgi:hypothetical protein